MTSRVGTISVTALACACLAGCGSTDRTGTAQAGRPTPATALVGDTAAITQASGPTKLGSLRDVPTGVAHLAFIFWAR